MFNIYLAGAVTMAAVHFLVEGRIELGMFYTAIALLNVVAGVML